MTPIRRWLLGALAALAALAALPLHAQTFNLFKPANGILKGATTTYVTTAAASSDVITLWSGTCNASSFLRGDGACAAVSAVTPAALTRTNDTNVTLTLGGTPATALLQATSLTVGWSGTLAAARGGTDGASPTDDGVMVGSGTTWVTKIVPNCVDTGGNHLNYTQSTNAFSCGTSGGGGGSPGGANTQVQFNNSGSFGGDANLTWDGSTLTDLSDLHIGGSSTIDGNLDVAGQITGTDATTNYKAAVLVENNDPTYLLYEDDAAANAHAWALRGVAGTLNIYACNDSAGPTCNSALALGRTGATPTTFTVNNIDMAPQSGTFTVNFDSACTTTPSVTFNYYVIGPLVTIAPASTSGFPCTGDSANFSTSSADVPSNLRPSSTAVESGIVVGQFLDNAANASGSIYIDNAGHMLLLNCTTVTSCAATWTASGNRNWVITTERASFTYYKH